MLAIVAEPLTNAAFATVALNGAAHLAGRDQPKACGLPIATIVGDHGEMLGAHANTAALRTQEFPAFTYAPTPRERPIYFFQIDTARRLRPLRRRLAIVLRPPLVAMRARKPCVRRRLRL